MPCLARLAECQSLEQLVERAEPAREHNEADRVAHEEQLAREEVVAGHLDVDVRVPVLLERQLDVQPDRRRAALFGAPVRRLHDPWTAARDDRHAVVAQLARYGACQLVLRIALGRARGPEYRNGAAEIVQEREAALELATYPLQAFDVTLVAQDPRRVGLDDLLVGRPRLLCHVEGAARG